MKIDLKIPTTKLYLAGAFFDMYLGDVPVSEETKKEIGRNVAGLIGRC